MPPMIKVSLKLALPEQFRGESNFFEASVKNEGTEPASDILPISDEGAFSLLLAPQGAVAPTQAELGVPRLPGEKGASACSFAEREGRHIHGPDDIREVTLGPGAQWNARADLLEWFGELQPGSYVVKAQYNSGYDVYESAPVPVKVQPIKPLLSATARNGDRHFSAKFAAAYINSTPEGRLLFAQLVSDALPKTPFRGLRVKDIGEPTIICPASLSVASAPNTHTLLSDGTQWSIATASQDGKTAGIKPLQTPMAGTVLQSPLSHSDGGVVVPFADAALGKLFLLRFAPDGALKAAPEMDLAGATPIGPYACCWQQDQTLHFVWATANGREVRHASRPTDDPDAKCVTHSVFSASGPILWLDAWIDGKEAVGTKPLFKENGGDDPRHAATPAPLMLKVWCVTATPSNLVCTEYSIADVRTRVAGNFKLDKEQKFKVLSSVVRHTGDIAVLLQEASGELWYASTGAGRLAPLREWTHKSITASQSPSLFACSSRGTLPWVYLRHQDQAEGRIVWTKVEPADEEEPGEHTHAH